MAARAKIIRGVHLLFTGGNGHKTYGITVESLEPIADVEACGYCRRWDFNDHSILTNRDVLVDFLGMTDNEYEELRGSILTASREGNAHEMVDESGCCDVL